MYNYSIIIVIITLEFMKLFENSGNILFHELIESSQNSEFKQKLPYAILWKTK